MPSDLNDLAQATNAGTTVTTAREFRIKRINILTGTEKDVSTTPCIVRGFWVNTTLSQAVTLYDGEDDDHPKDVIPAGITVGWWPLGDGVYSSSCRAVYTAGTGDLSFRVKSV